MKKQFFYAAMAVALMASCTSEDDLSVNPVEPTPDAEEQVAINLGVKTPNITVSRGTGTVGNVENERNGIGWDSQKLNIVMIDENTDSLAMETVNGVPAYIFDNLDFYAPRSGATEQNIRIYKAYTAVKDSGTIQHKYYPVNGKFNFYGYHVDDANGRLSVKQNGTTDIKVTGITINGSQDILSAQTIEIPTTEPQAGAAGSEYLAQATASSFNGSWSEMNQNQFSARTARNGFSPILDFKHNLARLKFYVKSGNPENGAVYKKDGSDYVKRDTSTVTYIDNHGNSKTYHGLANGAIYLTSIKAEDLNNKIYLDLKKDTAFVEDADSLIDFSLMSTDTITKGKSLVDLYPVAPTYPKNASSVTDYVEATPIGESLMFLPNGASETNIVLALDLVQNVVDTTDELNDDAQTFIPKPSHSRIKLSATNVIISGSGENAVKATKFEPGKSYNVYITIYSLEEIVVSAQLTEWKDGGDVDLDIENDVAQ